MPTSHSHPAKVQNPASGDSPIAAIGRGTGSTAWTGSCLAGNSRSDRSDCIDLKQDHPTQTTAIVKSNFATRLPITNQRGTFGRPSGDWLGSGGSLLIADARRLPDASRFQKS
jgi:hypothetical protein